MQERQLVDIVALTCPTDEQGEPVFNGKPDWRHGVMNYQTKLDLLNCPPGVEFRELPMQLNGIGEGVCFGIIDVQELYDPRVHGVSQRSNN